MRNSVKYIPIDLRKDTFQYAPDEKDVLFAFVVNQSHSNDFVKNVAKNCAQLRQWYHFYGAYESVWHQVFDRVFMDKFPDCDYKDVPMTSGFDDFAEFIEELAMFYCYKVGYVPDEVYIFYDDEELFQALMQGVVAFAID